MPKSPTTKTKVATATPTVTLMNYTIKAVIPTGPYANVQPEITVQAPSLDEAKDYVLPHIDALFEKYLNLSDRPKPRVVDTTPVAKHVDTTPVKPVAPAPVVPPPPMTPAQAVAQPINAVTSTMPQNVPLTTVSSSSPETVTQVVTPTPVAVETKKFEAEQPVSTAFDKAKMAVESCRSIEALNMIAEKIEQSIKLDALDKADLSVLVEVKRKEF